MINFQALNIHLAYPVLFLVLVALLFMLSSAFFRLRGGFYGLLTGLSLILAASLALANAGYLGGGGQVNSTAFLGTLNNDLIALYSSLLILFFSLLYLLMRRGGGGGENSGEFYSLFLFMSASFLLLVSSTNLLIIFLGLEASSLALYTLIALRGKDLAIAAALKYFATAAVGAGFFVLGVALIYIKTGSVDLAVAVHQNDPLVLAGAAGLLVLCGVKLSLVPFHFWLRDVYFGASTSLVAFISVVPKMALFAVVLRLFIFLSHTNLGLLISTLLALSMLAAALIALNQKDIKKLFAYSSVVHSSFVLAAASPILGSPASAERVLDVVVAYWILFAFANYALFLLLSFYEGSGYEALDGLFAARPWLALAVSMCALSLAGIPPFGLFWGKVLIFINLLGSPHWYLALLVAAASLLMIYMYLRLIIHMLFIRPAALSADGTAAAPASPLRHSFILGPGQGLVLFLCVGVNFYLLYFIF